MFILKLDGNPTTTPVLGLKNATITIRREDETGQVVYGYSSELTFTKGVDYDYIRARLIDDPEAIQNYIEVIIVDDCCDKEYTFKITAENIDWCEADCKIKTKLIEFNQNTKAYDCVASTMIWDDHGDAPQFTQRNHPRIVYCHEFRPEELQAYITIATMVLLLGLIPVFGAIGLIATIINAIIYAANTIPGVSITPIGDGDINAFDDVRQWYEQLAGFAIGCGRRHPSPLVRDYISNVCAKCGLSFQSSIFNDPNSPRYNTVYMAAEVEKGVKADSGSHWINENRPLHTGESFLNEMIKPVINGRWRIVGNVLILERKDFFKSQTPWLDYADIPESKRISLCYNWSTRPRYAFGMFSYSTDYLDYVGNESKNKYNDIVEWNDPYSPLQKGSERVNLPYGAATFRNQNFSDNFMTSYDIYPPFLFLQKYRGSLLMSHGVASHPKLLVWDGNSIDEARVVNEKALTGTNLFSFLLAGTLDYNNPMKFDQSLGDELYQDFYEIDNPKLQLFKNQDYVLKTRNDCTTSNAIDIDKGVMLPGGLLADVNTIEINSRDNTLTIKGTV